MLFLVIPSDPSKLDRKVCGHLNRTGQMCCSCQEGYAPPVYSYSLACVECSDYKNNLLKYLAVAYLPLTDFYFIVIFNISLPSLSVYVLLSQLVGMPPMMQRRTMMHAKTHEITAINVVITAVYGVWNLDLFFFELLIVHFVCIHT